MSIHLTPLVGYISETPLPRLKAGGGGVTIWGAFHNRGKSKLHILDGNIDQYQYIRVLETKILTFVKLGFQANVVFQNDNGTEHRVS